MIYARDGRIWILLKAIYHSCYRGTIPLMLAMAQVLRHDRKCVPAALLGAAVGGGAMCACIDSDIIPVTSRSKMIASSIGAAVLGGAIAGAVAIDTTSNARNICAAVIGGALGAASVGTGYFGVARRAVNSRVNIDTKLSNFQMENIMLLFRGINATRVATRRTTLTELCRTAERV